MIAEGPAAWPPEHQCADRRARRREPRPRRRTPAAAPRRWPGPAPRSARARRTRRAPRPRPRPRTASGACGRTTRPAACRGGRSCGRPGRSVVTCMEHLRETRPSLSVRAIRALAARAVRDGRVVTERARTSRTEGAAKTTPATLVPGSSQVAGISLSGNVRVEEARHSNANFTGPPSCSLGCHDAPTGKTETQPACSGGPPQQRSSQFAGTGSRCHHPSGMLSGAVVTSSLTAGSHCDRGGYP